MWISFQNFSTHTHVHSDTLMHAHPRYTQTCTHRDVFLGWLETGLGSPDLLYRSLSQNYLYSFIWLCFPHYYYYLDFPHYFKGHIFVTNKQSTMIDCFSAFQTQDFTVINDPRIHRSLARLNRCCGLWSGDLLILYNAPVLLFWRLTTECGF